MVYDKHYVLLCEYGKRDGKYFRLYETFTPRITSYYQPEKITTVKAELKQKRAARINYYRQYIEDKISDQVKRFPVTENQVYGYLHDLGFVYQNTPDQDLFYRPRVAHAEFKIGSILKKA